MDEDPIILTINETVQVFTIQFCGVESAQIPWLDYLRSKVAEKGHITEFPNPADRSLTVRFMKPHCSLGTTLSLTLGFVARRTGHRVTSFSADRTLWLLQLPAPTPPPPLAPPH